tara:strand:- start:961 stop:1899 length:939 start_codon:yes stop_codon:yes gene_type:complete
MSKVVELAALPFVFGIIYAPPKKGKTHDIIKSFPNSLVVGPAGGTICAERLGVTPETWVVKPEHRMAKIIEVMERASKSGKFDAIVIDDFSLLADQELHHIQTSPKNAGFKAFDVLNKTVYKLRDAARNAKCHVFLLMHETPPREVTRENKTVFIPGHPSITGWKLPEKLPALADFVVRIKHDTKALSEWPYVYQAATTPNYITGSRFATMPGLSPTNIREVMLATGYDLPRPEGMEWMEGLAENVATELSPADLKDKRALKRWLTVTGRELAKGYKSHDPRHIRWAISDGIDRAVIRRHDKNLLDDFFANF